jgi:hypothetical protein
VLRLEREDLVVVARTLSGAQPEVATEVAATKSAWPLLVNGLPADAGTLRPAVQAAGERAGRLKLPTIFQERPSASISGPGSAMAALFRGYTLLSSRGWQMIGNAIEEVEHGSPVSVRFARANVGLYIESVYDAHFGLAQIGKKLLDAYKKLGGAPAFGSSLTQAQVDRLADAYSEPSDRLYPHSNIKLGA